MRYIKTEVSSEIRNGKEYRMPCVYHQAAGGRKIAGEGKETVTPAEESIIKVHVPGSKSITNRALLLATLAEGKSALHGALFSDDSRHFLKCVQDLGFQTFVDEENAYIEVTGLGGMVPKKEASIYVGSAGTAARFLAAYLGVSRGDYHMDASEQMRRRPMAPLLTGLKELGCEIIYGTEECAGKEGFFPFTLKGHGFDKNKITIDIDKSSQFLSALLISSCLSEEDFTVFVTGKHGMAYIEMTVKMMEQFGVKVEELREDAVSGLSGKQTGADGKSNSEPEKNVKCEKDGGMAFSPQDFSAPIYRTRKGQRYHAMDYEIEPDVSAACYFYAMVPLLHIPVMVEGVHLDSMQGDIAFLKVLEEIGCHLEETKDGILLEPPVGAAFQGITVDMSAFSDQAITLAAIAPFAETPTTITGIGHIRLQESDRMTAIVTELSKMGIRCEETRDSITIYPGRPMPSEVETYDDHRMAMGFSLTGLRADGIRIKNPDCCKKTFEHYFEVLDKAIGDILQKGGE